VVATCNAASTVKFNILNATWDSEADLTVGTHTRTATVVDGHLFADGSKKATVTYVIEDKQPGQSTDPKGTCYVPPTPKVCVAVENGPTATNLDEAGWNHQDTRSTGAFEYVNGGIRLFTTDTDNPGSSQNKATLYRSVNPTPLAEFGEPSVVFADGGSGVKPGMQVGVDVDGDGTFDGYLVGEPWSYGDSKWWTNKSTFNVSSGMGYASFGSWADFVAANPNAKVVSVGLSLGSGVLGDWTVTSFTANCITYSFDHLQEVVKDATASVEVKQQATCSAIAQVEFFIEHATWDGEADTTVGTHTRTATANDGHLFADGSTSAEVAYTINEKLPSQSTDPSGECYVPPTEEPPTELPGNPEYQVLPTCGALTITFTNPVDVAENQVAKDAEFTYTDKNGETQIVTVPANQVVTVSIEFAEDSGEHLIEVGVKGGELETFTVPTDCEPNLVSFTPTNPTFVDTCGLTNDRATVPGTLVFSSSSTDVLTGNIYRSENNVVENGTYYSHYRQIDGTLSVEIWFVPNDLYAVPTAPSEDDTYTIEHDLAVWRYTFTNEACPVPPVEEETPTTPPTDKETPTVVKDTPTKVTDTPAKVTPVAKAGTSTTPTSDLAKTGSDGITNALTWVAGFLLAGLAMVTIARRRKSMRGHNTTL